MSLLRPQAGIVSAANSKLASLALERFVIGDDRGEGYKRGALIGRGLRSGPGLGGAGGRGGR